MNLPEIIGVIFRQFQAENMRLYKQGFHEFTNGGEQMQNRVIVHLLPNEKEALQMMSNEDVRPPDQLIRWLVLKEAKRRNLRVFEHKSTSAGTDNRNAGAGK